MNEINNSSEENAKLIYIRCDFCNSDKYFVLFKSKDFIYKTSTKEFNIVKCSKCGLVFTNPRLNTESLKKYYSKIINYDNRPSINTSNHRFYVFRRKDLLTDYFNYPFLKKNRLRKFIQFPNYLMIRKKWNTGQYIPKYKKNGKVLDIGCAYGGFLYQLKKLGWNVKGIELNEEAVKYAVNNLYLDVSNQSIEDFQSDDCFDMIYMSHILEHVKSPKTVLIKCYNLLNPNGKLILSIPDFSGIEARIFKKYAYGIQLPFHLYHFTPKTIKKYLTKLNFRQIKIIHKGSTRDIIGPLVFILMDKSNKLIVKMLLRLTLQKTIRNLILGNICNILSYLGITSRMTIIAKR